MNHKMFNLLSAMMCVIMVTHHAQAASFTLVDQGKSQCEIYVNVEGVEGTNAQVLQDAAAILIESIKAASGAELSIAESLGDGNTVVLARAGQYPDIAAKAGINLKNLDAFVVVPDSKRLYILGTTEVAVRHGVVEMLHQKGFRWYAPSPKWWIAPESKKIVVDETFADESEMRARNIWYAYGVRLDSLKDQYNRWRAGNRLYSAAPLQTGHSYGNIIGRNKEAFEQHPEYFALGEDGKRDIHRGITARKFCVSNAGLIDLVVKDRVALLKEKQALNPYHFMVSVDPSDGQGACYCDDCVAVGTTTDRVIHLANAVARGVREYDADAWVGLYGYSSHRMPPTIDVEPNVYVQVAMGFNRTPYSLPQLVSMWGEKVGAVGLREYYGVEAWDWGLPGKMRGGDAAYHAKWIPYYTERNVNALNAETNANWGGQSLGLYVSSRLMWDPQEDVDAMIAEYFENCYGKAAEPMRRLQAKFDRSPPLSVFTLSPMFDDMAEALSLVTEDGPERDRLIDMASYMVYVDQYLRFDATASKDKDRGDEYYEALKPLMMYAYQVRERGMVHSYALARRLCNGLPLKDGRLEYWFGIANGNVPARFLKEGQSIDNLPDKPVWQNDTQLTDDEVLTLFKEATDKLKIEKGDYISYDSPLVPVKFAAEKPVASHVFLRGDMPTEIRTRYTMNSTLYADKPQTLGFKMALDSRSCNAQLFDPSGELIFEKRFDQTENKEEFHDLTLELPGKGLYKLVITNNFLLQIPSEARMTAEASVFNPFHSEYSGGQSFYVPKGTKQVVLDVDIRLSLLIPEAGRRDLSPKDADPQTGYISVDVPEGGDGRLWYTFHQTRGKFYLINCPPVVGFNSELMLLPEEVVKADGLQRAD